MTIFDAELGFARELAASAGEVLVRHFGTGFEVQMKGWADPVTIADQEAEALIEAAIRDRFPSDGIYGEEGGRREIEAASSSGRVWVIDPLDGTANFSAGLPNFTVVLTLVEASAPDRALLNVTYDPIRGECFYAVRGHGAYLDDRPIRTTTCHDLARALVHLHFSRSHPAWELTIELARRVTARSPHARNLGSTALAQAYVAAGRLDAHAKVESGDFDVVGGNLLVEEAGGAATDLDGRPWRLGGGLLAAGSALHPLLLELTTELRA